MANHKLLAITKQFPKTPGVYIMKNSLGEVIYVGKAVNLQRRATSYFIGAHDSKTELLVSDADQIEYRPTDSAIEALILESNLISRFLPKYNIKEKDDKSYLYVWISKEPFPRVELIRGTDIANISELKPRIFGPYLSGPSLRGALEIIRKIIPYRSCRTLPKRMCLYGHIGLCDAPCVARITQTEYKQRIDDVIDFLRGNKQRIVKRTKLLMNEAAKAENYELAAKYRNQLSSLVHIRDTAAIAGPDRTTFYHRIEGYDLSGISGQMATGSMVVFIAGESEKSQYRKFKIKTIEGSNDVAMLAEVLRRRFRHKEWPLPDLLVIDGGKGHLNMALRVQQELNLHIPMAAIAKGPDRKKDEFHFHGLVPDRDVVLFKKIRDEAHRFAKGYYTHLHRRRLQD